MSVFSYIRSIYALDTIDTRFTNSSSTPYQAVVDRRAESAIADAKRDDSIPGTGGKTDHSGRPVAQPSKWNTPEFYIYYLVFIIFVPLMFKVVYDVSKRQWSLFSTATKSNHLQHHTQITINSSDGYRQAGYQGAE